MGFRKPRTLAERHAASMSQRPGNLLKNTISEMKRFLVTGQGASMDKDSLQPIVRAYLTSVLLPSTKGTMSARNQSELQVLAEAVDRILQGDYGAAADLLMLRFQQVEMAHGDGGWKLARHLLQDLEGAPSSTSRSSRGALVQEEARHARLQALTQAASR